MFKQVIAYVFIIVLFKVLKKINLLQAVLISFRVPWFSKVFCFNLRNVKEIINYALLIALMPVPVAARSKASV